jgi:hypothetical protein
MTEIFAANPSAGFCWHDKQDLHMLIVAGGSGIIQKGVRASWEKERASVKAISKIWSHKCHASEFEVEYNWINLLH